VTQHLSKSTSFHLSYIAEKYKESKSTDTYDTVSMADSSRNEEIRDGSQSWRSDDTRAASQSSSSFAQYSRPADPRDQYIMEPVHAQDSRDHRYSSVNGSSFDENDASHLTSSTAVRETDINYINDISTYHRSEDTASGRHAAPDKTRRTRVNIQVPNGARAQGERWLDTNKEFLRSSQRNSGGQYTSATDKRSVKFQQPLVDSADGNKCYL